MCTSRVASKALFGMRIRSASGPTERQLHRYEVLRAMASAADSLAAEGEVHTEVRANWQAGPDHRQSVYEACRSAPRPHLLAIPASGPCLSSALYRHAWTW